MEYNLADLGSTEKLDFILVDEAIERKFYNLVSLAKLGEDLYNTLNVNMNNQVDGEGKWIKHYSYNLASETEQKWQPSSTSEGIRGKSPMFGSQRTINSPYQAEETIKKSNSIPVFFSRNMQTSSDFKAGSESQKSKNSFFRGEREMEGFSTTTITQNPATTDNGSRAGRSRKFGLGDIANRGIMSHRLRKKAVCDSTDNLHYQRQFLRVLNKRF